MELFYFLLGALVLGAFAGAAAAITHQALINKTLAKVHEEVAKFETLKAKL